MESTHCRNVTACVTVDYFLRKHDPFNGGINTLRHFNDRPYPFLTPMWNMCSQTTPAKAAVAYVNRYKWVNCKCVSTSHYSTWMSLVINLVIFVMVICPVLQKILRYLLANLSEYGIFPPKWLSHTQLRCMGMHRLINRCKLGAWPIAAHGTYITRNKLLQT